MGTNAQERHYTRLARKYFKNTRDISFLGYCPNRQTAEARAKDKNMVLEDGSYTPCVINTLKQNKQAIPRFQIKASFCSSRKNERTGIITYRIKSGKSKT